MSEFFQHYPQIGYDISGLKPTKTKSAINIMIRSKLKRMILDDVVSYFPYTIREGERPDTLSFYEYGDVKYTWLIFLINNIQDPIFEWPLNAREFGVYIKDKYGSITAARNVVHHYEQTIRERVEATSTSEPFSKATIEVDLTTYNTLAAGSRRIVYYYDWEVERNEDKRNIKLIDSKYVASVLSEHAEKLK